MKNYVPISIVAAEDIPAPDTVDAVEKDDILADCN